jgi:hypothetical protein
MSTGKYKPAYGETKKVVNDMSPEERAQYQAF